MQKLTKNDICGRVNFITHFGTSMYDLSELASNTVEIDYDVFLPSRNKNLQRDFVWTLEQKQEYILSCLKGLIEVTLICVVKDRHKDKMQIIDGKQRLSTLIDFYKGKFPVNVNGIDYYYNDIDVSINNFRVTFNVAYNNEKTNIKITDDQKVDWFFMINFAGTPQEQQHMNSIKGM